MGKHRIDIHKPFSTVKPKSTSSFQVAGTLSLTESGQLILHGSIGNICCLELPNPCRTWKIANASLPIQNCSLDKDLSVWVFGLIHNTNNHKALYTSDTRCLMLCGLTNAWQEVWGITEEIQTLRPSLEAQAGNLWDLSTAPRHPSNFRSCQELQASKKEWWGSVRNTQITNKHNKNTR